MQILRILASGKKLNQRADGLKRNIIVADQPMIDNLTVCERALLSIIHDDCSLGSMALEARAEESRTVSAADSTIYSIEEKNSYKQAAQALSG